ncbi:glycosyltransferase [Candidatus Saccharibacteria bacterium]|nr:glycosyltransferase [Candidatus Saccharibacteria bacterium]
MKHKIALISEHASPLAAIGGVDAGGQNVAVAELAQHLAAIGYEVDVFTRWDDRRLPAIVNWRDGVRVIHVKAGPVTYVPKEQILPFMSEFTDFIAAFIEREGNPYKLIHAHFFMSALVAADLKKRLGIPFVVTFHALGKVRRKHQGKQDWFSDEGFAIEERAVLEANQIVALCPQDHEDLVRLYNADPAKIAIIPNGYNPSELYPMDKLLARTVLGLDPKEKVILQLGRMVKRKGVDTVVKALAELKHTHRTKARLVIVGGESDAPDAGITPEIGRLQALAEKLEVSDMVTFTGRRGRDALHYYYSAADVFVTVPWYEPFGITPVEAMACGTPVVGSAVGGIKHTVREGETGFLVPPKDAASLAGRLKDILSSRKLRDFFSENALRHVKAHYTWARVANSTATMYERVVLESPRRVDIDVTDDSFAIIDQNFAGLLQAVKDTKHALRVPIMDAAQAISRALLQGNRVLLCGNGGSAAEAQHFATELVGHYKIDGRRALPAQALTTDGTLLTAWGNDAAFDQIFSRQVEAFGQPGDVLIALTTSGNSPNIVEACHAARKQEMFCIGMLGGSGGAVAPLVDIALTVPSHDTPRIQEIHQHLVHTLSYLVERSIEAADQKERERLPQWKFNKLSTTVHARIAAGQRKDS